MVKDFGEITATILAKASIAYSCLMAPIFCNCTLSVSTQRAVHKAVMISIINIVGTREHCRDMDSEGST